MKTRFIFIALMLTGLLVPVKAQQTLTLDVSHASNYLAHGRTLSNDLACFQPGIYYGLKTGTTIMGWVSVPWDRKASMYDEWNIIIDQNNNLFKDKTNWNINLHGYANYWYLPNDGITGVQDYYQGMKYNAGIHFPLVLSQNYGLKMTAGYDYYYYHQLGRDMNINAAGIHEILVKFNKSFKSLSTEYKAVISNNRGAIDDGINPGWAYLSQHLSVLYTNKYISLRPSVNYQWTMEKTIHEDNLLWFSLGVIKTFEL